MSDVTTQQHIDVAVRAPDAEREQTFAVLRRSVADGRLTQAELEERAGAAYVAQTWAQLLDLTADLPADEKKSPRPRTRLDPRVLCALLCVHPPAGLVYLLLTRCHSGHGQASAAETPTSSSWCQPSQGRTASRRTFASVAT